MRLCLSIICLLVFAACSGRTEKKVVVYTALDEIYSRPILADFEKKSGLEVQAVYDTEASKTTGLVTRLTAEKTRPRADVFWNNEVAQTILLKERGVLEPYRSPAAEKIPDAFKDKDGYWTGFSARARVIIYNTNLVSNPPLSIMDLADERWDKKTAIALPLFGTTATHSAALFALWGEEKAKAFLQALLDNHVAVLSGNAAVRDQVARGEYAIGLTDSDDANGGVEDGLPVKWLLPDQGPDQMGTLLIPNSVALIKGAPNAKGGRALIDHLLSPEVERQLATCRSIQIPLNPNVEASDKIPRIDKMKTIKRSFEEISRCMPVSLDYIKKTYAR